MVDASSIMNSAEQAFAIVPGHTTFMGVIGSPGAHVAESTLLVGLVAYIASDMIAKDAGFGKKIFGSSFTAGLVDTANKYLFNGQLLALINF